MFYNLQSDFSSQMLVVIHMIIHFDSLENQKWKLAVVGFSLDPHLCLMLAPFSLPAD